jgi:hypothetical protein
VALTIEHTITLKGIRMMLEYTSIVILGYLSFVGVTAAPVNVTDKDDVDGKLCPCQATFWDRPDIWKKAETARWMVHNIDWGVLTTISSRTISTTTSTVTSSHGPIPFGNVYSFVDGSCTNATGIPYFYGTYMDQSLQDMKMNPTASFTLSEASIVTSCIGNSQQASDKDNNSIIKACRIVSESISHPSSSGSKLDRYVSDSGDPESPVCARLTLTGILEPLLSTAEESIAIQGAFYQRHPQMHNWPIDHRWIIFKLNVQDIWLIDYFGGATVLTPEQYFNVEGLPYTSTDKVVFNDPI